MIIKSFYTYTLFISISVLNFAFAQTYNQPESAVYDATGSGRWLISNWGNGDILARANDGSLTYFNQGASIASAGMAIVGNTLYVAGQKSDLSFALFGFDLSTGILNNTIVTDGFTSDVTADAAGTVYVSSTDKIYQVDLATQTYSTIYTTGGGLNGVLFDEANNRLIFTDDRPQTGSAISALDMATKTETVLIANSFSGLDGLTVDNNGNYYVSSYVTNSIYRYDPNFTGSILAAAVPDGVADIYFDIGTNTMGVPTFGGNSIIFIPFDQLDAENEVISIPSQISLHQNYPNPFNPTTTINYDINEESLVNITVYNLLGSEVIQLINNVEQPGEKSITWDGRNSKGELVKAGAYIYKLNVGTNSQTRKMVLLK